MSLPENLFAQYWHLGAVTAVLLLLALSYLFRFVWPARQLGHTLAQVNRLLGQRLQENNPAHLNLQDIEREVMTDPRLQHVWRQYAHTLHARWMPTDAGPLGQARERVSQLSKSFFAEMSAAANGGRVDLSEIEQITQNNPRMADLWQSYNQSLQALQEIEATSQNQAGAWQATAPAAAGLGGAGNGMPDSRTVSISTGHRVSGYAVRNRQASPLTASVSIARSKVRRREPSGIVSVP